MDLLKYKFHKAKGNFSLAIEGGDVWLRQKAFNPTDGTPLPDAVHQVNVAGTAAKAEELQSAADNLKALLDDIKALQTRPPSPPA